MTAVSPPVSWRSSLDQSRSTSLEPRSFCQYRLECQKHLHQLHNKRVSKDMNISLHSITAI